MPLAKYLSQLSFVIEVKRPIYQERLFVFFEDLLLYEVRRVLIGLPTDYLR